jgi:2-oxoisovalerate dehydrogenase E1 component
VGVTGEGPFALISFANGHLLSRQAQKVLAREGVETRVIDLRWLNPLPANALVEALEGCSHALIVDETRQTGGVSEALMTLLTERTSIPHVRLAAEDSFIATGPAYAATMPSANSIVAAAQALVEVRA